MKELEYELSRLLIGKIDPKRLIEICNAELDGRLVVFATREQALKEILKK